MNAPAMPKLGSRRRTDPALTLAKLSDVVSPHCGIVTGITRWAIEEPPLRGPRGYHATLEVATALGDAALVGRRRDEAEIWRTGRQGREGNRVAFDDMRAFVRAVGEALERYACGIYEPHQLVTATWGDIRDHALDPCTVQRPDKQEYARFRTLRDVEPRAPMRWAWGWRLRDARPLLVPAQLCWVAYNPIPGEPRLAPPTSTGWALHHTREEAIHTALREVIERDSFFLHWLARMTPPRLDASTIPMPDVRSWLDEVRTDGAQPHVLVTTTDLGIASFAVAIVDRREDRPAFQLTLAAHPDPRRGLRQAVEEAAMTRLDATMHLHAGAVEGPETMEGITKMSHHAEFYLRQENLPRLAWLLEGPADVRFEDLPDHGDGDVWQEVLRMDERIAAAGLDTLYVDTTPSDLREAGWQAAKVLVPGSIRHEYGHGLRSLACPRIYEAPVRMGRRKRPLTRDAINTDAHPYS